MKPTQYYIISEIINQCQYTSYLELGIRDAVNFNSIANLPSIQRSTAVDIDHQIPVIETNTIKKCIRTTDDFFKLNSDIFDVVFIDADHNIENVKRDFNNALNILSPLGTIFLHDTDPINIELLEPGKCSNSYLINQYLDTLPNIQYITLPVHIEGLTIIRKKTFRYNSYL
jgi:predicted O-methyltransferase YrrM